MRKSGKFPPESQPVKIVVIDSQNSMPMHFHDFYELVVVCQGTGVHNTKTEEYRIERGDVFLIKPEDAHSYSNTEKLELINLLYRPDRLKLPMYDLSNVPGYFAFFEVEPAMRSQHGFKSRLRLSDDKLDYLKNLIMALEKELDFCPAGYGYAMASLMMQIILFVSRNFTRTDSPGQKDIIRLSEVLSYIGQNYAKDITLETLAKKASMSETTLYRMFRKTFGESPVNYVITVRIGHARELLANSNRAISDIAWEIGFHDSNYFSRHFKKHTGMTPREYRRRFLVP